MAPQRVFLAWTVGILVVGLALAAVPPSAAAQAQDKIPRTPEAEMLFEQGLAAYERGDYETAYERFRLVDEATLNQKTTAALLMGARALLQLDRYEDAAARGERLLNRYPNTSYRGAAEELLTTVREAAEQAGVRSDTLRVGIALPMSSEDVTLSQALFNGIRLAVDEHNGVRRRYLPPSGLEASADTFEVYDTEAVHGDSLAEAEGRTTVATPTDTVRVDSLRILTEQVRRPSRVAKMHFRDTGGTPDSVRQAVQALARRDEVDVIIGPLFSGTARAAGAAAEQARVLLVPPLANAPSVSAGREYVFQPNPIRPLRGRLMARFAAGGLLADRVAIVYEQQRRISEQMATGFREEAREQGLEVPFTLRLQNGRDWSRLPDVVEEDSTLTDSLLAGTNVYYLPMTGSNASGKIQDALTGLGRLTPNARALGNAEWHDLPIRQLASQFQATYTNDFFVQTEQPAVQAFVRRYRLLTGNTPDNLSVRGRRLAYTGYDVARFLLKTLTPSRGRPGPAALRSAPAFEGLGTRIDFEGGNVNRAMFFHRYRNNRLELLR